MWRKLLFTVGDQGEDRWVGLAKYPPPHGVGREWRCSFRSGRRPAKMNVFENVWEPMFGSLGPLSPGGRSSPPPPRGGGGFPQKEAFGGDCRTAHVWCPFSLCPDSHPSLPPSVMGAVLPAASGVPWHWSLGRGPSPLEYSPPQIDPVAKILYILFP